MEPQFVKHFYFLTYVTTLPSFLGDTTDILNIAKDFKCNDNELTTFDDRVCTLVSPPPQHYHIIFINPWLILPRIFGQP